MPRTKRTTQDAPFFFFFCQRQTDLVDKRTDHAIPSNAQLYPEPTILPLEIFGEKFLFDPSSSHVITAGTAVQV